MFLDHLLTQLFDGASEVLRRRRPELWILLCAITVLAALAVVATAGPRG